MPSLNQLSSRTSRRGLSSWASICAASRLRGDFEELARLPQWLARGYGGRMTYLNRTARVRADVRRWLPSARSVVAVACHLQHESAPPRGDGRPRAGAHRALRLGRRLSRRDGPPPRRPGRLDARRGRAGVRRALVRRRRARAGEGLRLAGRHRVDRQEHVRHQPRDWVRGSCSACWRATSTSIRTRPAVDQCGTCRLCVDACPAGAFVEPYVLDARRCLSYLTIEIRGSIPAEQRPGLGAHVFGCDICQDVCPYNAVAPLARGCLLATQSLARGRDASNRLWALDDAGLERAIEGTALRRAGVRGLRRNLAVAIGNAGPSADLRPSTGQAPGAIALRRPRGTMRGRLSRIRWWPSTSPGRGSGRR